MSQTYSQLSSSVGIAPVSQSGQDQQRRDSTSSVLSPADYQRETLLAAFRIPLNLPLSSPDWPSSLLSRHNLLKAESKLAEKIQTWSSGPVQTHGGIQTTIAHNATTCSLPARTPPTTRPGSFLSCSQSLESSAFFDDSATPHGSCTSLSNYTILVS